MIKELKDRFRGFFPVVFDIETAGFNAQTDAVLEIAAITFKMNKDSTLSPNKKIARNIFPFEGSNIEESALKFLKLDNPFSEKREALYEVDAIKEIYSLIRSEQKANECQRSILVAHNAAFDQSFINAINIRHNLKRTPLHPFSTFDTVSLAGLVYGETVLSKACEASGIDYNKGKAHNALYDAEVTSQLFCNIVNKFNI